MSMKKNYTDYKGGGLPGATNCQKACPLETDVSRYVALVANGRFSDAMSAIREVNPFPAACGRVCDHQCETQCRRAESDSPVAIKALKRFLSDRERALKTPKLPKKSELRPERVAVIGAGPAGLTAAADLAMKGFRPTVFEVLPKPGGMMRYGIPEYRLPQNILDHDISYIEALGVEIVCGKALGADFTLADLKKEGFKAVILAPGAQAGRKLPLPGSELPKVVSGISLLRSVKIGERPKAGARSVVIGGGDVAMDVARTALRLGAESVKLVCLEPRDKMPAHDWEVKEALDEKTEFLCGWGPTGFAYSDEILKASFSACVSLFDASGKFAPKLDPAKKLELEADAVYLAIGQHPDLKLDSSDGVELSPSGFIKANPQTLQTGAEWIFAAGDAAEGLATVVKAIASGHKAAASVVKFLEGKKPTGLWTQELGLKPRVERVEVPYDWELRPRNEEDELPSASRAKTFDEIKAGLGEKKAIEEATRCFRCDADTKSYTYSRANRERINRLARDIEGDEKASVKNLQLKIIENLMRRAEPRKASLDDLIFLPANLTRLVIDPYREKCKSSSTVGAKAKRPLNLKVPIVLDAAFASDFANAPEVFGLAAVKAGLATLSDAALSKGARFIKPVGADGAGAEGADALELRTDDCSEGALKKSLEALRAKAPGAPVGVRFGVDSLAEKIVKAAKLGFDFATLDASQGKGGELVDEAVRIEALPVAVGALRAAGYEEEIDLLYFGGVSGGADLARLLSLGAKAVILGEAARIAAGADAEPAKMADGIVNFVKSCEMEAAILARCCGKTDILNLEPEDLRSLTVETAKRTGIPVVGKDQAFALPELAS